MFLALGIQCGRGREGSSEAANAGGFFFPTTGVAVEKQAMLLAIDEYLFPLRENVSYYLTSPMSARSRSCDPTRENPKAPDPVAAHFYGTVLHDGGKFRMWYYACHLTKPADALKADLELLHQGPVCYAESDDGIRWTKPNLGQAEIHGSKDNNAILLPDQTIETVNLIKEENDPDPQRRYKMVYNTTQRQDLGHPERDQRRRHPLERRRRLRNRPVHRDFLLLPFQQPLRDPRPEEHSQ